MSFVYLLNHVHPSVSQKAKIKALGAFIHYNKLSKCIAHCQKLKEFEPYPNEFYIIKETIGKVYWQEGFQVPYPLHGDAVALAYHRDKVVPIFSFYMLNTPLPSLKSLPHPLFKLTHEYTQDENKLYEVRHIGLFSSLKEAKAAEATTKTLPGFDLQKEGFNIKEVKLNERQWSPEYISECA